MGEEKEKYAVEYNEEGVDLGLIRWFMDLTPTERLRYVNSCADSGIPEGHPLPRPENL